MLLLSITGDDGWMDGWMVVVKGVVGFLFLEKEKIGQVGMVYHKARVFPFLSLSTILVLHFFIRTKESRNYGLPPIRDSINDIWLYVSSLQKWSLL